MLTDTKEGDVESLLLEGQDAARRGDLEAARAALSQVVERDPDNEVAWMWLSGVVDDPAEQQICLENVLVINPDNDKARQGLEYLQSQASASTGQADAASAPPAYAAGYTPSVEEGAQAPQQYATSAVAPNEQWTENPDIELDTPEFNLEASGLELQTSPTLEGAFPWLQSLGPQNEDPGLNASGSEYNPGVAVSPFDPITAFGATIDAPPAPSPMHETSFAGVADEPFAGSATPDVEPFTAEPEELPMFDFSSFTDSIGTTQSASQSGGDSSVDFGNPHFKFEEHVAAQAGGDASSNNGFMPLPAGGFSEMMNGPMGPMADVNLPAPSELP